MTATYRPIFLSALLVIAAAAVMNSAAPAALSGPEGVEWRLIEAGGVPIAALPGGPQPHLLLDPTQQKVSGYSGCNSFFGGYVLEGSRLTFGLQGSTRRACPEAETALEKKFLGILGKTSGWKVNNGELFLLDENGVLARFTAGKIDNSVPDPGSMTYRSPRFPSGAVTLSHGEYRVLSAPGSSSETVIKATGTAVFGMIGGMQTGAVVLVSSSGGTGSFYELALLSRGAAGWENTDTVLLGDRVKVRAVAIGNDEIIVDMTTHGPTDPLCCPTLGVKKRFVVRDGRLVPAGENTPDGQT